MANHAYAGNTTRPQWGGASSDVDIHVEVYKNEVDTKFQYSAIFRALSRQRSVQGSNVYRMDRLGASAVKGRQSGIALDPTKVTNDKFLITVDTTMYIRNPIDYQDDWTGPDYLMEMGQNNGTAFAEAFDQAHIITLQKGAEFTVPAHLKANGAFHDGAEVVCNIEATPASQAELEANAIAIEAAHKLAVETLIRRKVPLGDMVTLIDPAKFSALTHHPKLGDTAFDTVNGGMFGARRVVQLNGIPVVECTEFPQSTITGHILSNAANGNAFDVDATDIARQMIIFSKSKTLVTVEAQPFVSKFWNDDKEFCNVLDCYAMYTVGCPLPGTAVSIRFVAS